MLILFNEFNKLLYRVVEVSNGIVDVDVLTSGEIVNDKTMESSTMDAIKLTKEYIGFKTAGTKGIIGCVIQSIILPLLEDHVLREANHYLRILS